MQNAADSTRFMNESSRQKMFQLRMAQESATAKNEMSRFDGSGTNMFASSRNYQ